MAPRASQRPATQQQLSQPNGRRPPATQARGYGRRQRRVEEEEEIEGQEDGEAGGDEEEGEGEQGEGEGDGEEISSEDKMAHNLVRLALFTEYKHAPLRRDDINKKVLGKNTRSFRSVYDIAQTTLRETFGMELVPLQSSAGHNLPVNGGGGGEEDANATGIKKKVTTSGPRSWILRSILPPSLIRAAAERDADIAEAEEEDWAHLPDEPHRSERAPGTLLAWQSADEVGLQGLLFVILSLVLVNGRGVPDPQLRSYLKKLRIHNSTPLPTSSGKSLTLDAYLSQLVKLSYLDRIRTHLPGLGTQAPGTQAAGRGNRRGRGEDEEAGDVAYEWRWGPRAEIEIGEKGIADFVADVYLKRRVELQLQEEEESEEEQEEEERPARRGRGRNNTQANEAEERRKEKRAKKEKEKKELERILKDVERAAGGALTS